MPAPGYDHWKTTNPADEFLGPEPGKLVDVTVWDMLSGDVIEKHRDVTWDCAEDALLRYDDDPTKHVQIEEHD